MDGLLKNKRWLKILILACIIVPMAIFILQTDVRLVWQEMEKIGFRFLYLLASTFVAYLLGTFAWWVCLADERKYINLFQLFSVRQIGETVGLYNPTSIVGGDLLKDELLKAYHISRKTASTSVVISRITVMLSQLLLFIVATSWLLFLAASSMPAFLPPLLICLIIFLSILQLLFFYTLHRKPSPGRESSGKPTNWWKTSTSRLRSLLQQAQAFYQQQPKAFWSSYLLSMLHWLVGSFEFYLILQFLGYDVRMMHGLLLDMGVIIVKSLGAFVPGQLGVEELGNKFVLAAVGIHATAVWIAVSVLRRSRQLFWILIGILCYAFIRKPQALPLIEHGSTIR